MTAVSLAPAAPVPVPNARRQPVSLLLAVAITVVLIGAWTLKDWAALRLLRLPDNDDMMRIAEVRDWLNGQAFNDLMQYRLGPPGGASMHWSRIADAGPALLILLLTPLLGPYGAELGMVILYPAILFFAYLLLTANIAKRLGGEMAYIPALLLAALAFPTISLFLPGRIDHHGLQIVLSLVLVDALVGRPSVVRGAIGGIATAASLAIGLEAAPEIVAVLAASGVLWLTGGRDEDRRAIGFGAALGGITLGLLLFARPYAWPEQWCDGFTPGSSRATLALAGVWLALGAAGRVAKRPRARLAIAGVLGATALAMVVRMSPVCLSGPYDALTPFLKEVWMSNVSEARDLFFGQDTIGTSIAYGGVIFGGTFLALRRVWRQRFADRAWMAFTLFLLISTIAAVLQVRVTYILAGIATIPFALAVAEARAAEAGAGKRVLLWVLGAGVTWNLIAGQMDMAFAKQIERARVAARACTQGEAILIPGQLPKGTIMAPIDLGSYLIGMTPHHVIAAGYHRNNSGNMAMYRFFLAKPEAAGQMARAWGIDYVALCPENMRESSLDRYRPGSLIEALQDKGRPPAWLQPIHTGSTLLLYRVR